MQRESGNLWYAPTDIVRFLASPYASFMERRYLEDRSALTPDETDPIMDVLSEMGDQHEDAELVRLREDKREVREIPRGADAETLTRQAVESKCDVIYQARLSAAPFRGFADFLEWSEIDGAYVVWDAKLSSSVKPYYLIQLCCYAEMLEAWTGVRPVHVGVLLGNGERVRFRTDDFFYYYLAVKRAFLEQMGAFDAANPPEPEARADHGRWSSHADALMEETDHLVRVAGVSKGQIKRLRAADVLTMTDLAESTLTRVPKIDPVIFDRLREQASLQMASKGHEHPMYRVLPSPHDEPRRGLATLPPSSPMDVFFDMEGDPLVEGGLEYLFGAIHLEAGKPVFWDSWAYEKEQEQAAFERFVDWVVSRWRQDPSMHIYHYAPYEVTALKRLMGHYATREDEIDELLRNHVFVDLYRLTRDGVRIGTPSYSLKDVEKLYLKREGEVSTASESIVEFERFLRSNEPADWTRSPILKSIRDYNEVDCVSTWELAQWLRTQQADAAIDWRPPAAKEEKERSEENQARLDRRLALVADLHTLAKTQDGAAQHASSMLAHLVEFHRREDKPAWWSFFARHDMTPEERYDEATCIGKAALVSGPEPIKKSQGYRYQFDPRQDCKVTVGDSVYLAGHLEHGPAMQVEELKGDQVLIKVGNKTHGMLPGGTMPEQACFLRHGQLPTAILVDAIEAVAQTWLDDRVLPASLTNVFARTPPRIHGVEPGQSLIGKGEIVAETTKAVRAMQGGTLCIQGPPGSGKTYTASHVIQQLLDDGKNVGVVSNSHEAVINVMRKVNERCGGTLTCVKVGGDKDHGFFTECEGATWAKNGGEGEDCYDGGLIGGTAWLFARNGMADELDYLFVDEAGQVSLANLVSMSRAARNIVLLGDQMQLAQPLQGTHPEDSGQSALEYVLQEHVTVPPSRGIFLPTSYRMHPDICSLISGAFYEDRLTAREANRNRVVRVDGATDFPLEAGIYFVPVAHEGNDQASEEEVAQLANLSRQLAGRTVTSLDGEADSELSTASHLFVAPFNLQVGLIREAIANARAASVDKFQGQEAPVVLVSLCRSADAADSGGRGLDFVLDANRLNVAMSRGQCLAVVVGDPNLVLAPANSVEAVKRQNLLARVIAHSEELLARS